MGQLLIYVVDREVLLPQGDDFLSEGIGLWSGVRALLGREEEISFGVEAELMAQDAEAPGGVAEAFGGFGGGEVIDEVGSKSLVLPVGRVFGREENKGEIG